MQKCQPGARVQMLDDRKPSLLACAPRPSGMAGDGLSSLDTIPHRRLTLAPIMTPDSKYSKEILEVVDHEDRVVGTERRGVIHARGLMHRSAQVLLFNPSGQLFLQKRSMGKDEFPGLWDSSAAGHLAPGETYHQCALRELEEELGIRHGGELTELFKIKASAQTGYEHCTIFKCVSDSRVTLQAEEVDEGRWLSDVEMDDWVKHRHLQLTPAIRRIWQKFRETKPEEQPDKS